MIKQIKPKVLALGNQMMLRRLSCRVDQEEVSLTGCPDTTDAINILARESFDVVIIDNFAEDAETLCQKATCLAKAPVALMLPETTADWQKIRHLTVDGYLPDTAGRAEFMARIKALLRRKPNIRSAS